jgi:hypothetical protein
MREVANAHEKKEGKKMFFFFPLPEGRKKKRRGQKKNGHVRGGSSRTFKVEDSAWRHLLATPAEE